MEVRIQAKIRVKKRKIAKIRLKILLSLVKSLEVLLTSLFLPIKIKL